jgi:SPP1 gp7 family putative phage head morphogenesis protein
VAYSVSTDPQKPEKALAWFRSKLGSLVTRKQWDVLDARAKRRAFFVSGTARLDLIQQVWDMVGRAIDDGTPFGDFQSAAKDELGNVWLARDSARLETIFRNNIQSSYAAGRYQQQTTPDALTQHPVWQFDAILDGRTTAICSACNGTTLPATDPWWSTHVPPLHHRCRSGIITISEAEAKKSGGITQAPAVSADTNWGAAPAEDEWKPEVTAYALQLQPAAAAMVAAAPAAVVPTVDPTKFVAKFTNDATADETRAMFSAIDEPALLDFLEKNPLRRLYFQDQAARGVFGWYQPSDKILLVATHRDAAHFAHAWVPGATDGVSRAGATELEAARRTFVHEVGHHIRFTAGTQAKALVVLASQRGKPITRYAATSPEEYFAESFAAYKFHRADLESYDPVGFKMVEAVLRLVGILP